MKRCLFPLLVLASTVCNAAEPAEDSHPNPLVRYDLFAENVTQVGEGRAARCLDETAFLKAMKDPEVVLLDARTERMFALRHLEGAVNLPLPDFSEEALARLIPSKATRILIYCNNNFRGDPISMVSKSAPASLNVHTHVTLRSYGYENVWELEPLLDVGTTKLPMAGRFVDEPQLQQSLELGSIRIQMMSSGSQALEGGISQ